MKAKTIILTLALCFVGAAVCNAQGPTPEPLSVPPYHNLPTTEGYFQGADGVRLFYRVAGRTGDPILFLHGGPGLGLNDGGYDMEPLAERGHRVLMFNERGAGRSEIITDASKLRMQDYVQDVEEFRKKFGLEKLGIIGLSWGSAVAVNYITAHPERVTRVVFLSPMSPTAKLLEERKAHLDTLKTEKEKVQERELRDKIKTAADVDVIPLCEQMYGATMRLYVLEVEHFKKSRTSFCPPPIEGLRNTPFVMKAAVDNLGDWDFRPLMKNVHVPALVLEGAETNVPLDATREWVTSLPNARLLLIPNAGHQNWVDQPEAVTSAMDEFFRGNWPVTLGQTEARPRVRDTGVEVGIFPPGPLNAITDVAGVKVGHTTLIQGDSTRTGVTAILPHGGNLFQEKVPGAVFVGNAFGKLIGSTQVNELGEIETPVLLTSTLATPKVADALISYMLSVPGNEKVQSVNPLVGETNDGYLNDIRSRLITAEDVFAAIHKAKDGPIEEGCVGAGTGTVAFGFKGGVGTSSRRLSTAMGGYTIGVLVQSNFGGILSIAGVPIAKELGNNYLKNYLEQYQGFATHSPRAGGSIMIVVATDAPLEHRNLSRLAARAMMGLARTGASGSNGSGDYVIAFSTAPEVRIQADTQVYQPKLLLSNGSMSPLFEAVIEATEEAIYNSLFQAHDMSGRGHTVKALPLEETIALLKKHSAIPVK